jgi:hypothetical protein
MSVIVHGRSQDGGVHIDRAQVLAHGILHSEEDRAVHHVARVNVVVEGHILVSRLQLIQEVD